MADVILTADLPDRIELALGEAYDVEKVLLREAGSARFLDATSGARAIVAAPGDPFGADLVAALPRSVRLIASYSTGLDHIDLGAAAMRGIEVTSTPDVLTDATADTAMLLVLGALRGAAPAAELLRNGWWSGWKPAQVFGVDLRGRTLGIAGAGRIGVATASRAASFGMELTYWGRRRSAGMDGLGAAFHQTFDAFLGASDVVSLHVPSTPETRNLIDGRALSLLKPGSFLVNTGRGDLVDDEAVLAALASGRLAGVGLDVFRGEPALHCGYLSARNAFLLPHIGSSTVETREAMGASVLSSLARVIGPGRT